MSAEDERDDDREPDEDEDEVADRQHQRFGPGRYLPARSRPGGRWVLGGTEPAAGQDTIGNSGP